MEESLLTVPDIATRLKKAPKTIYMYLGSGVIPKDLTIRLNGSVRMKSSDLEKYIESNRGKEI